MKTRVGLLLVLLGVMVLAVEPAAADLYVVQVGDGAAALSNVATTAFIKKFANDGTPIPGGDITLPTAASGSNAALTLSGTAVSEGFLTQSANGQYLTIGGYNATPGTASVTSSIGNRVAGRIAISGGAVDTSTILNDASSIGNPRSVVSNTGNEFWLGSSSSGIRYATLGSTGTSTQMSSSPTNTRVVNIVGGQLYTSSGTTAFLGPSTVGTGLPTTSGQTTTLLPGFPTTAGPSPYDYWIKDASTIYLADDNNASAGGGIQKWTLSGGTWSLAYTLPWQQTLAAARGLAGMIDSGSGNAVLFATSAFSSTNRLVTVTDTGAGATVTTLATAPTNTVFRGVELVNTAVLAGDYNGDHKVDAVDYTVWRDDQGAPEVPVLNGNGDGSGTVDDGDFTRWKNNFNGANGSGGGGLGAGPVPEPASIVLLAMGAVGFLARLRRSTR